MSLLLSHARPSKRGQWDSAQPWVLFNSLVDEQWGQDLPPLTHHRPWHYGEHSISKLVLEIQTHLWTVERSSNGIQSTCCDKKWRCKNFHVLIYLHCYVYLSVVPAKTTFTLKNMVVTETERETDFVKGLVVNRRRKGIAQWLPLGCKSIWAFFKLQA